MEWDHKKPRANVTVGCGATHFSNHDALHNRRADLNETGRHMGGAGAISQGETVGFPTCQRLPGSRARGGA